MTNKTTTTLGHTLAHAVVVSEFAANRSHMSEHSLAAAGKAIATRSISHPEQASEAVRDCLLTIKSQTISDLALARYCDRNRVTVQVAANASALAGETSIDLHQVKQVIRNNRAKAATTAIRRALDVDHILEIGKERDIDKKTITFRELTATEKKAAQAKKDKAEQDKADKKAAKEGKELVKSASDKEMTDQEFVALVITRMDSLPAPEFQTLLDATLAEQAKRINRKPQAGKGNTALRDALTANKPGTKAKRVPATKAKATA